MTVATIAAVVGVAAGANSIYQSTRSQPAANNASTIAQGPAASQYPTYQGDLASMFPSLSNLDPTAAVKSNPYYNFLLQQATGPGGSIPSANKATFGSSRNGQLPLDTANYSAQLAGQFGQQQISNQMGLLGILAQLGGFGIANPGAAGNLSNSGFTNSASLQNGGFQSILGGLASFNKGTNPNVVPPVGSAEGGNPDPLGNLAGG